MDTIRLCHSCHEHPACLFKIEDNQIYVYCKMCIRTEIFKQKGKFFDLADKLSEISSLEDIPRFICLLNRKKQAENHLWSIYRVVSCIDKVIASVIDEPDPHISLEDNSIHGKIRSFLERVKRLRDLVDNTSLSSENHLLRLGQLLISGNQDFLAYFTRATIGFLPFALKCAVISNNIYCLLDKRFIQLVVASLTIAERVKVIQGLSECGFDEETRLLATRDCEAILNSIPPAYVSEEWGQVIAEEMPELNWSAQKLTAEGLRSSWSDAGVALLAHHYILQSEIELIESKNDLETRKLLGQALWVLTPKYSLAILTEGTFVRIKELPLCRCSKSDEYFKHMAKTVAILKIHNSPFLRSAMELLRESLLGIEEYREIRDVRLRSKSPNAYYYLRSRYKTRTFK